MGADAPVTTRRLRRVEYERLIELGMFTGERIELLDGVLVVREPQGSSHAATTSQIAQVLTAVFGSAWHARLHSPLALDAESEPEPDIAVVTGAPRDYLGTHPATAALVVEVADSSLGLDRRTKGSLYARAGLLDYWIVNLVEGVVEVYRDPLPMGDAPNGWGYRSVVVHRPPAAVAPLAVPDRRIRVADLLP